jgi:cyanate permease
MLPQASLTAHQPSAEQIGRRSRNLLTACIAHALHDGYTDGLYAFLPIWQAQFGLSYAGLAMVRALYYATMGGLQLPAERLLRRVTARNALLLATLIAAAGFAIMALPLGFAGLCLGLVMAGIGSSIQHPRGSTLVHETYGEASRRPLGIYNFSGDLGKASLPALASLLLPLVAWRPVMGLMALLGVMVAGVILALSSGATMASSSKAASMPHCKSSLTGFSLLTAIGGLDTAVRMGFLLFLPFMIHQRGGSSTTVGLALALLFIGGLAARPPAAGWASDWA